MLYYAVAGALKAFDLHPATRKAYRLLGNLKNRRAAMGIEPKYFAMSPGIVSELFRLGALRDGANVLELGTGWTHWDALLLRNHASVSATLYDIWDNRSFDRFKHYVRELTEPDVRRRLGFEDEPGLDLMRRAADARTFGEAYAILGFRYLADPTGTLAPLPDNAFDLIVSRDVGEHLRRKDLPAIAEATFKKLRPGGWAFHQIVLTDHIRIYLKNTHLKAYLAFDRETHHRWISSNIQYTNLLQIPEWHDLFEKAGFVCASVRRFGDCGLSSIKVHPSWQGIPEEDLACTVVQFYLQKPPH